MKKLTTTLLCAFLGLSAAFGASSQALAQAEAPLETVWDAPGDFFHMRPRRQVPPGVTLQRLAVLTNDRDARKVTLSLMVEKGLAAGMFSLEDDGDGKPYWMRDIESKEGVVLLETQGKKALIMGGSLDRETQEGKFTIHYLTNGLFNRYASCDFRLKKKGDSWYLQNAYTRNKITMVNVVTHSLGITTLEGLCPTR